MTNYTRNAQCIVCHVFFAINNDPIKGGKGGGLRRVRKHWRIFHERP